MSYECDIYNIHSYLYIFFPRNSDLSLKTKMLIGQVKKNLSNMYEGMLQCNVKLILI